MKAGKRTKKRSARKMNNSKRNNSKKMNSRRTFKKNRLSGGGPINLALIGANHTMINKPCKCGYLNFNMSEIGNELKLELTK